MFSARKRESLAKQPNCLTRKLQRTAEATADFDANKEGE